MDTLNSTIQSDLISLDKVVENKLFFNIPIYQRLYVWKGSQIKVLFADLYDAWLNKNDIFYLGGVIVVKHENNESFKLFDLIDGQQRFTTLWLLSIVFGNDLHQFIIDKTLKESVLRINFSIREHATTYFKEVLNNKDANHSSISSELNNIEDALALIKSLKNEYFKNSLDDIPDFASFLYKQVKLIFTEVPAKTDLNKLFEVINNRGVQLQHHEILKAALLSKITNHIDRIKYGYLWNACSYMNGFIEKNLKEEAGIRIQDYYENNGIEKLADPNEILSAISADNSEASTMNLLDILKADEEASIKNSSEIEYEADDVRSIISFPMLLLHTLRIFNLQNGKNDISRIKEKELLKEFNKYFFEPLGNHPNGEEETVEAFIELLWKVRYAFDKFVIKWVNEENEDIHSISLLYKQNSKGNYYLQRRKPETNEGFALLQSMLYHSQEMTTQYWLTPFLAKAIYSNKKDELYAYLMALDNRLFTSSYSDKLIERTWREMNNQLVENIDLSKLHESSGVNFSHYWFYKLEFILWFLYASEKDERWKKFRITAKNSVEHISPQHPKETDVNRVSENMLNKLGNLALVSRSINSEYSNLPFNEKRQRFKNNNSYKVDSLKMDILYKNNSWSDDLAKQHQDDMLKAFEQYLNINKN
jgi:hypothetical protein